MSKPSYFFFAKASRLFLLAFSFFFTAKAQELIPVSTLNSPYDEQSPVIVAQWGTVFHNRFSSGKYRGSDRLWGYLDEQKRQ
jgi:hypothetical protein